MQRIRVLAVVTVISLAAAAPAHAAPRDLAAWLDDDAPLVIGVHPAFLESAAAMAVDSFGKELPDLQRGIMFVSAGSGGALGFDLLSTKGWAKAGFDPSEPLLMSIGAIDDAGAEAVYDKLFSFKKWNDKQLRTVRKVFWRSRAVFRVADAGKVENTLKIIARTAPDLFLVNKDNAAEIAMLVGERPRKADAVIKRLRKADVAAIGWLPGLDSFVAFRFDGKQRFLLVDVVGSFAGVPAVWPRDSNKLLQAITRVPGNSKLPKTLARGAGDGALGSGLAIWIQPAEMLDTAKATGRHRALQALAGGSVDPKLVKQLHKAASDEIGRCDEFRPFATKGPFVDVAFTLDVDAHALTGSTRWGLRKGFKLGAAMMKADDGLVAWGKPSDAVITAAHYLDGFGLLRALPRPKLLDGGFDAVAEATYQCGSGGTLVAGLFGWPQLAGLALDELRKTDKDTARIVDGFRNGVVAVKRIGKTDADWELAAAGSFDDTAAAAVTKLVESLGGSGKQVRLAGRKVTTWKLEAMRAFRFDTAEGEPAFGVAMGRGASKWLLAAVGGSEDPPLARWRVDVPALLGQLAALEPGDADTLKSLARKLARADGTLDIDGDTLAATMKLRLR